MSTLTPAHPNRRAADNTRKPLNDLLPDLLEAYVLMRVKTTGPFGEATLMYPNHRIHDGKVVFTSSVGAHHLLPLDPSRGTHVRLHDHGNGTQVLVLRTRTGVVTTLAFVPRASGSARAQGYFRRVMLERLEHDLEHDYDRLN